MPVPAGGVMSCARELTLVLPPYRTSTGDAIADAAVSRRMKMARLERSDGPFDARSLRGRSVLYAARLFGDQVAESLDLGLLEPAASWLADIPRAFTGRYVRMIPIGDAWQLRRPVFVKPADGKAFPARVYPDGTYLPGGDAIDSDAPVIVSEQITPYAEYRLFVLDGEIVTGSRYAIGGDLLVGPLAGDRAEADVLGFTKDALQATAGTLPSAVVVDVGRIISPGRTTPTWAVIEANAAWSSGVYACDPQRVLDTVLRSGGPRTEVSLSDARFLRPRPVAGVASPALPLGAMGI